MKQIDTPRGRKTQLKHTREIESLKRGLDWEIQQFELSLNEFEEERTAGTDAVDVNASHDNEEERTAGIDAAGVNASHDNEEERGHGTDGNGDSSLVVVSL